MRIGPAARKLGFQTHRRHALRLPADNFVGCGFAWQKEGDAYFLELEVWMSDAYSEEQPALVGIFVPRFLLTKSGLVPYEGFETDDWDSCLFSDFDSLKSAVDQYFEPWAEEWTNLQTLTDYYRQLEGITDTATKFTESPSMAGLIAEYAPYKAPINSYYLSVFCALQGHTAEALEWSRRWEAQGGCTEEQQRVIDDIKRGQYKKMSLAAVVL